jgi:hypothetical protein
MPLEQRESLWVVVSAPLVWAGHFLLSYCTAAVWCAKFSGPERSLATARVIIAVYTACAFAAVGLVGAVTVKRHKLLARGGQEADTDEDRHRFLGFATLLLCGLSAIAIAYSALAVVIIGSCH